MRFDDMLATVLAQPRDSLAARIAVWRQLADILAQQPDFGSEGGEGEAAGLLRSLRGEVPETVRTETATALAGRLVSPGIVTFFAEDRGEVAAAAMLGAGLHPEEWIELMPDLPSHGRALLRHRRDLQPQVMRALEQFESADMILERPETSAGTAEEPLELSEVAPEAEPSEDGEQIRTLVEKIEAFQRERPAPQPVPAAAGDLTEFRFEAGADGVVHWVEGAPRGPLIGQTIAFSADALDFGVDGHAAGAFRRRAPFRDARLVVAGEGPAAGSWRISAVPFFDEPDGRFAGYRGLARRPRRGEEAAPVIQGEGLFGSALAPDSLRQLIHELRTPLNAIVGFAEMIEQQLLGPVSAVYRGRASAIAGEAARLLQSVEDLDTAARVETDRLGLDPQNVDGAAILERLHDIHAEQAETRGVTLAIRIEQGLPRLAVDPIAAERMIERLLAATVGLAGDGEKIEVDCGHDAAGGDVTIEFSRPVVLAGKSDAELLDPGYSPEGDWPEAPALGLGFALRLVRNIAQEADGRLDIDAQNFVLRLPAKDASSCSGERGS